MSESYEHHEYDVLIIGAGGAGLRAAIEAKQRGLSVGAAVLTLNACFLWLYSLSCHACRHFCGGQVKSFAKHPIRHKLWKLVTPLNAHHMRFAWISLFGVALCDLYVRLVASGTIHDPGFHF